MTLKLYNTLTRKKEVFKPIDPKNVRMYVCGPTVYDYAHVGNFRPVVVFDVLYRLLRHIYGEKHVTYARNITDIDDKIMKAAKEAGADISEIAEKFTKIYNDDAAALNALPPTCQPKATDYLQQMKAMIEKLIGEGHAYEAEGHVLFHVPSMKTYGRLSKKPEDELVAGARVEVAPYKKDPRDFVLWKPSTPDQPGWESRWGRGRPGWHLECSCMTEDLAETIDIHGGGLDLIFPHHENEIAQSECAHGKPMARFWIHNGYLTLKGEKMSKSLGNVTTMHELLKKFPGEAIRLTLLSAHYRQPLDFSDDAVKESYRQLDTWYRAIFPEKKKPDEKNRNRVPIGKIPESIISALKDDLNTPAALAELEKLSRSPKTVSDFLAGAQFFGLLENSYEDWFQRKATGTAHGTSTANFVSAYLVRGIPSEKLEALINERDEAKKVKDYAKADKIRADLEKKGILLEDTPSGTEWRVKRDD